MLILRNNQGSSYKGSTNLPTLRYPIDPDKTLEQFDDRFEDGDVFRSATELCDLFLVPEGQLGTAALDVPDASDTPQGRVPYGRRRVRQVRRVLD